RPTAGDGPGPLAGLRVIDLASFIAGPVVSRHLAMLGAEVIKVEPPTGDPFRAIGPLFLSWNQGKRSIALDLTTPEGQAELHRLAATADVVVENFRPGVSARLGVDRDTLSAVNPNLVFLSSPGYGTDEAMAARPAFDPLVQALGGIMAAQGGLEGDGPEPVFLTVPVHDVVTPIIGAFGAVLGLARRARTGRGQHVRTSLVQSTMVAQAAEFTDYAGRPAPAVGGFDYPGPEGDTWTGPDGAADRWCWHDGARSVEVCRVGLTATPLAEDNDLVTTIDDPDHGRLVVFGQLVGGAGPAPGPPPGLGAHTEAIRAELAAAAHPGHDDPS
ncbi:MAG: CaiB/BaiF CoA transferase family protein, partial [Acidimicrobiales bacterium]